MSNVSDRLAILQRIPTGATECGKKRFFTRQHANDYLVSANSEKDNKLRKSLKNVYKCSCGFWHTTSMNKRQSRNLGRKKK